MPDCTSEYYLEQMSIEMEKMSGTLEAILKLLQNSQNDQDTIEFDKETWDE